MRVRMGRSVRALVLVIGKLIVRVLVVREFIF